MGRKKGLKLFLRDSIMSESDAVVLISVTATAPWHKLRDAVTIVIPYLERKNK